MRIVNFGSRSWSNSNVLTSPISPDFGAFDIGFTPNIAQTPGQVNQALAAMVPHIGELFGRLSQSANQQAAVIGQQVEALHQQVLAPINAGIDQVSQGVAALHVMVADHLTAATGALGAQ